MLPEGGALGRQLSPAFKVRSRAYSITEEKAAFCVDAEETDGEGGLSCSKGRESSTHTGIVRRILRQNDIFLHMSKCGVGCSKPLPTENIQFIPEKDFFPPAHLLDKAVAKIKLLPFSWTERAGAEGRKIVEGGSAGFRCRRARTWKAPPHPWPTLTPTIPCPHLAPPPGGSNVLTVKESPRAATTWMSAGLRACTEK